MDTGAWRLISPALRFTGFRTRPDSIDGLIVILSALILNGECRRDYPLLGKYWPYFAGHVDNNVSCQIPAFIIRFIHGKKR